MSITKEKDLSQIVETAVNRHGTHGDALIPILLEINEEYGHIPASALQDVSGKLHAGENGTVVSEGQLFSLASFYHMLSTKQRGEHVVQFCESAPCHVQGGRELRQAIQEYLGLAAGETSPDGKWTLVTTSCIGLCGVGPVIIIDEELYGNVTPEQLPDIFARYE
ncbi:MAG: NAD(P)H-dependent oxidoreductase subunit E [Anaerolineales bacterium]|nr:NAD(P)H-dependent oxidoreductase subunit E [Anaerolineales bacterium]